MAIKNKYVKLELDALKGRDVCAGAGACMSRCALDSGPVQVVEAQPRAQPPKPYRSYETASKVTEMPQLE